MSSPILPIFQRFFQTTFGPVSLMTTMEIPCHTCANTICELNLTLLYWLIFVKLGCLFWNELYPECGISVIFLVHMLVHYCKGCHPLQCKYMMYEFNAPFSPNSPWGSTAFLKSPHPDEWYNKRWTVQSELDLVPISVNKKRGTAIRNVIKVSVLICEIVHSNNRTYEGTCEFWLFLT